MEKTDLFELIRSVEVFTNEAIIRWSKSFEYNIGISTVLVLALLQEKGEQKQTVLAQTLGYTPGAMTNIAGRLVKLGMAERLYNENDRRNVLLSITEKGKTVLAEAQRKGKDIRMQLFGVLSEEEQKQFLELHRKLVENLEES